MQFDDDIDERFAFADGAEQDGRGSGFGKGYTVEVNKEPPVPPSPEERYQRGRMLFLHNPAYIHVFLDTVAACDGEIRTLNELEERISALPGYAKLKNPPYFPVSWLRDAGVLEELYLDAEGKVYEAKDIEALDEDAFDDLVAQYAYRTTDLGRNLAQEFSPARRLAELFEHEPARKEVYLELMTFLCKKRSFPEVEQHLRVHDPQILTTEDGTKIQPSMFVDKLGAAGAVSFDGGWMITAEGKEMLEAIGKA